MNESISQIIFILLSIAGIVYIWKSFLLFILRNKNDNSVYVIIPIIDSCDCVEQLVRSTAERTLLMGKSKWDKVICVDYGCNKSTREIIEKLCEEYSFLNYLSSETFEKIFAK
jgi:hypothetical protein